MNKSSYCSISFPAFADSLQFLVAQPLSNFTEVNDRDEDLDFAYSGEEWGFRKRVDYRKYDRGVELWHGRF